MAADDGASAPPVSPPATGDFLANIQIAPTIVTVASSVGTQAFSDANALSTAASGLTATQTFGTITNPTTITGNCGQNVIDVANIQNAPLTLSGGPNDIFVFNASGQFMTNQAMTLTGGVTANHILWNLTGTSGNIFQTSGGNMLDGTFLATDGGNFQFSALDFVAGQRINTDGHIQFVSNSSITSPAPFVVPALLIGHGLWVLLSVGGVLSGGKLLERSRKPRAAT